MSNIPEVLDRSVKRLMELDQASVFALADFAAERLRQVEAEGWTPEHDDAHRAGEMAQAAAAYAIAPHIAARAQTPKPGVKWPWAKQWWKPKSIHENQVRAGALLVAECARRFRSAYSKMK